MSIRVSGVAELLQCVRPDDVAGTCIESARRAESVHGAVEGHWGKEVLRVLRLHRANDDDDPDTAAMLQQLAELDPDKQAAEQPEPQPLRVHNAAESQARRAEVRHKAAAWIRAAAHARGSALTTRALLGAMYAAPKSVATAAADGAPQDGALQDEPAATDAAITPNEPFAEGEAAAAAAAAAAASDDVTVDTNTTDDDEAMFGWYMPCEDDVRPMQLYPRGDDFAVNTQIVSTELQPSYQAGPEGWACATVEVSPEMAAPPCPLQQHEWSARAVLVPSHEGTAASAGRPLVRVAPHPLVIPSVRRAAELKAAFGDVFQRPNQRCSYAAELRRVWESSSADGAGECGAGGHKKSEKLPPRRGASAVAVPMGQVPPIRRSDWGHLGAAVAPLLRAALFNRVVQPRTSHNTRVDGIPLLGRRLLCTGPMRVRAFDMLPGAASLIPTSEEKLTVAADDAYIELHPVRFVLRPAFLEPSVGALPLREPESAAAASASTTTSPLTSLATAAAAEDGVGNGDDPMAGSISSTAAVSDGVVVRSAAVARQNSGPPVMTRQSTACDPMRQREVLCGLRDADTEGQGIDTIPMLPGGIQPDGRPAPWLSPTSSELPVDPAVRRAIRSAVAAETSEADVDVQAAAEWAKLRGTVITGVLHIRVKAVSIVADVDVGHRANNTAGVVRVFDATASVRRVTVSMQLEGRPVLGAIANTIVAVLRPTVRQLVEHHLAAGMVGTHRLS